MKSVCIAIGVSSYEDDALNDLPGAEIDARRFFQVVTDSSTGVCDATASTLLLNPTRDKVRETIAKSVYSQDVKNLTLFFAGHGGEEKTGYYLACHDSEMARLPFNGLSLTDVFQLLGGAHSIHANLIIDACNAGGLVIDIPALTKSFDLGTSGGLSVSVLVTSAREETAGENASGGYGTNAILDVIEGRIDNGTSKQFLTLADVSQAIKLHRPDQTPSFWSFNLRGSPVFSKNLFAIDHRATDVFAVPIFDKDEAHNLNGDIQEELWHIYLSCGKKVDPRKLHGCLGSALSCIDNAESAASLLVGLLDSFLQRSRMAPDAFAPVVTASVFAASTTHLNGIGKVREYMLRVLAEELDNVLLQIAESMENDDLFLVRGGGGHSDFFALPQRITGVASWALAAPFLRRCIDNECREALRTAKRILASLSAQYMGSFELISEQQASGVLTISALSKEFECIEWSNIYIGCLYNSFHYHSRKVARSDLTKDQAYTFLRHRLSDEPADYEKFCDRPSEALFVLLAHYWFAEQLEIVRYDLKDLDGAVLGTFIPNSYSNFDQEIIAEGSTIYFRIGFEVFTIYELSEFFAHHLKPRVLAAAELVDATESCLSLVCALVFPDRMPWHICEWNA